MPKKKILKHNKHKKKDYSQILIMMKTRTKLYLHKLKLNLRALEALLQIKEDHPSFQTKHRAMIGVVTITKEIHNGEEIRLIIQVILSLLMAVL